MRAVSGLVFEAEDNVDARFLYGDLFVEDAPCF